MEEKLHRRLSRIKLVMMDVDGVLTDGSLYYGTDGERMKKFFVRDGLGIKLLQREGLAVAFITALESDMVKSRARDLGIEELIQGRRDKERAVGELLQHRKLDWEEAAYIGDDLIDLPVIRRVGFAAAVADAAAAVKEAAHYITELPGGRGAVREVADMILETRAASNPDEIYTNDKD